MALQHKQSTIFDIIFCERDLEYTSSVQLLRILRRSGCAAPFVDIHPSNLKRTLAEALEEGFFDTLTLSYTPADMYRVLSNYVEYSSNLSNKEYVNSLIDAFKTALQHEYSKLSKPTESYVSNTSAPDSSDLEGNSVCNDCGLSGRFDNLAFLYKDFQDLLLRQDDSKSSGIMSQMKQKLLSQRRATKSVQFDDTLYTREVSLLSTESDTSKQPNENMSRDSAKSFKAVHVTSRDAISSFRHDKHVSDEVAVANQEKTSNQDRDLTDLSKKKGRTVKDSSNVIIPVPRSNNSDEEGDMVTQSSATSNQEKKVSATCVFPLSVHIQHSFPETINIDWNICNPQLLACPKDASYYYNSLHPELNFDVADTKRSKKRKVDALSKKSKSSSSLNGTDKRRPRQAKSQPTRRQIDSSQSDKADVVKSKASDVYAESKSSSEHSCDVGLPSSVPWTSSVQPNSVASVSSFQKKEDNPGRAHSNHDELNSTIFAETKSSNEDFHWYSDRSYPMNFGINDQCYDYHLSNHTIFHQAYESSLWEMNHTTSECVSPCLLGDDSNIYEDYTQIFDEHLMQGSISRYQALD